MDIAPTLLNIVKSSAYFSESWYLSEYPDVQMIGIDPAEHYLWIGAAMGRDPGPDFSTSGYLEQYSDVAEGRQNALVHFEQYGRHEQRVVVPRPATLSAAVKQELSATVDVVVPVFNALEDVRECLRSLARYTGEESLRVIVVNDGSDEETSVWLRGACSELNTSKVIFTLLEHDGNKGYTMAVNTGLKASTAPYVVTLNSDTIVTEYWVEGLLRCINSDPKIGIAGPLSNAASWQNVPDLYGADGNFAINALPPGMTPNHMATIVRVAGNPIYPRSTFVNGFCFMIKRAVIDAVGYMDEEAFPIGYGEENDFCIRAQDAGYTLAFADDTYVFHAKSKSFGSDRRKELSKAGTEALKVKHSASKYTKMVSKVKDTTAMDMVRARVRRVLDADIVPLVPQSMKWAMNQRILFLLPVSGGSGGAHSVVQEVTEMRRLGIDAKAAILEKTVDKFNELYGDIPECQDVFVGFRDDNLLALASDYDVVIATIFTSVKLVDRIVSVCPWIVPAYYAQDYEPMFFAEETKEWLEAYNSYSLVPNCTIFAKTDWIREIIQKKHGVNVLKVSPSIDHEVYFPGRQEGRSAASPVIVTAMIRPQTPRRGAARTMQVLSRLKQRFGEKIQLKVFGCSVDHPEYVTMQNGIDVENLGILTRNQVAALLREADIFIDLSDYQAFGRTGLEAMACGTVVMIPREGGADEYAIDGRNALVVDTLDTAACYERLETIIGNPAEMDAMKLAGMETATQYSPRRAAISELTVLGRALAAHRMHHPKPVRSELYLVTAGTKPIKGVSSITGSGHVRIVYPYRQEGIYAQWQTILGEPGILPPPTSDCTVLLQRDLPDGEWKKFDSWYNDLKAAAGTLVYEIDDDLLDSAALVERGYRGDAEALARRVTTFCERADVITVSTPRLVEVLSQYRDKVRLVPNYISDDLWKVSLPRRPADAAFRRVEGVVKIGYVGTPTHDQDLAIIKDAMLDIVKRHNDKVEIEVIGAFQTAPVQFGKRVGLPKDNRYPIFVEWLHKRVDWDISIIPLAANSFNQAKSNLKFLECAALNTAIVCSDNDEYRRVGTHDVNCLMVPNDTQSWVAALERLISDANLRTTLAKSARDMVASSYTVEANIGTYLSVLAENREGRRLQAG